MDLFLKNFKDLIKGTGFTESELMNLYRCWLNVRYSHNINITSNEAISIIFRLELIISNIFDSICTKNNLNPKNLEKEIYKEVLGARWLTFQKECALIHDKWQHELEVAGEMGHGSKLGNKLLNPSNFSYVFASSDEKITRGILGNDEEIGEKIAWIYQMGKLLRILNPSLMILALYGKRTREYLKPDYKNYLFAPNVEINIKTLIKI